MFCPSPPRPQLLSPEGPAATAAVQKEAAVLGRRKVADPHGVAAVEATEEVVSWGVAAACCGRHDLSTVLRKG